MKYLALYLRGPMQSWGASSKFGNRGTLDAPTRSGLLGMLAAACGIDKNDKPREREWLSRAAGLSLSVFAFRRGDRMNDYHTVGARYDKENAWQRRMIPTAAENGKPKPNATLTSRDYLTDSVFGAIFAGDDAFVDEIAEGLSNPVWGVWFGRKNCIPTEPVFAGVFDSEDAAAESLLSRFRGSLKRGAGKVAGKEGENMAFEVEETSADDSEEMLLDVPVSFSRREFQGRRIRHTMPLGDSSEEV